MAGRAREGRRSWWIGSSKAGAVDTEDNNNNSGGSSGGSGGGGCWGGYGEGRGFSRGNRGDPITLLVKAFRSNSESSIIVSLKIEVYIS